ncbi:hypothetical protein GCM10007888_40040 [Methylobacterium oxalidis]|uniref:Uncharacterized protein n=1 Tax=Methylobacterium oxalidis TaxID=944322 RepID=A0ABQ6DNH6_9HYPH|nr:hypothetical protein GCM10007888_40040 [Methylobacterium oxalidis]
MGSRGGQKRSRSERESSKGSKCCFSHRVTHRQGSTQPLRAALTNDDGWHLAEGASSCAGKPAVGTSARSLNNVLRCWIRFGDAVRACWMAGMGAIRTVCFPTGS